MEEMPINNEKIEIENTIGELYKKSFNHLDSIHSAAFIGLAITFLVIGIKGLIDEGTSVSSMAVVFSKSDLGKNAFEEKITEECRGLGIDMFLSISSVEKICLEELKSFIEERYENLGGTTSSETVLLNRRHALLIEEALNYLDMGINALDDEMGLDCASSVLRLALDKTGEITGKSVSSELVDNIFSRFCIGK